MIGILLSQKKMRESHYKNIFLTFFYHITTAAFFKFCGEQHNKSTKALFLFEEDKKRCKVM